jgi:copper chaperone CopZ
MRFPGGGARAAPSREKVAAMATESVQMKVSGLMCSFCTMSLETALKRYDGVKSVVVNLVHGIVLVEADTARITRDDLTRAVERLGYDVSSTEVQQYETDEALFTLIKRRGMIGMILAILDLLVDPLNIFGLAREPRAWFSFAVAAFILFWVGYPILRKTILAIRGRLINANVLLSTGAWGSFVVGTLSLFDPRWPNFLPVAGRLMALHLFFGYFKLDTRNAGNMPRHFDERGAQSREETDSLRFLGWSACRSAAAARAGAAIAAPVPPPSRCSERAFRGLRELRSLSALDPHALCRRS